MAVLQDRVYRFGGGELFRQPAAEGLVRAAHLGTTVGALQTLITCSWPLVGVARQRAWHRAAAEFLSTGTSFSSDTFSCYTHDFRRRISAYDNATFRWHALNCDQNSNCGKRWYSWCEEATRIITVRKILQLCHLVLHHMITVDNGLNIFGRD